MMGAADNSGSRQSSVLVMTRAIGIAEESRAIAGEAAIAIEINGLGYAVMMATPVDLVDFGVGFALSEGIARTASDIIDVEPIAVENGWLLRLTVKEAGFAAVRERVRHRLVEGSCGLCGLENLEQVLRPVPPITAHSSVSADAIFRAIDGIRAAQPLNAETGAVHGAAFCDADGGILLCREDIGRHNAMDKLIGAASLAKLVLTNGFVLLTSRCSFELVEKAVRAQVPMLVTISGASTLALDRAISAHLTLVSLARRDAVLVMSDPFKRFSARTIGTI